MTTTIIILLSLAVVLLVMLLAALIWRNIRQSDELRQKNDVIVREVRRNQALKRNSVVCPKCGQRTTFNMPDDAIDEDGEFYRCQHCGWSFHYK